MVNAETMPALHAFAEAGTRFVNSRSTFPTETRVNQSALVTGCYPQRHGIVGNCFVEPTASPTALFNTGDEDALREGDTRLNGRLFDVPTLGELLYRHGATLATISAGTPGGGRILHHRAESMGAFRLALKRPDAICGPVSMDDLAQRFGPIPPPSIPSNTWLEWSTDVFLGYVQTELQPDVSILWYCEPDNSYHRFGVGSPESLSAIAAADAQFARIHAWSTTQPNVQLITLSDHGQIAALGEPVNVPRALKEAGFTVADVPGNGADLAVSLDTAGGVYLNKPSDRRIDQVIECLAAAPWCGLLSTATGRSGTLRHRDVFIDHARAPDVGLVLAADSADGPFGWPGTTVHDSGYGGGGVHGGLSRFELNNWMAMAGSRLRESADCAPPAGLIDVLPTVMLLLDLPVPTHVQGRVLREALRGVDEGGMEVESVNVDVPSDGASRLRDQSRLHLRRQRVGKTYYLDSLEMIP